MKWDPTSQATLPARDIDVLWKGRAAGGEERRGGQLFTHLRRSVHPPSKKLASPLSLPFHLSSRPDSRVPAGPMQFYSTHVRQI